MFGELQRIAPPNGVMVGFCMNSAAVPLLPASGASHPGTAALSKSLL